jgi:hypothetical protein
MHGGRFLTDDVPFSCCNPQASRPCVHHAMKDTQQHYNYFLQDVTVYKRGCSAALHSYFTVKVLYQIVVATLWIILPFAPLLLVFRYLQTSNATAIADSNPYGPARGYLWIRRQVIKPGQKAADVRKMERVHKSKKTRKSRKKKKARKKSHEKSGSDDDKKSDKSSSSSSNDESDSDKKAKRAKAIKRLRRKLAHHHKSAAHHATSAPYTVPDPTDPYSAAFSSYYQTMPYTSQYDSMYGPYAATADAYFQYYNNNLLSQPNNNNDPDARQNVNDEYKTSADGHEPVELEQKAHPSSRHVQQQTSHTAAKATTSEDLYDEIDPDHQPVPEVPPAPPERRHNAPQVDETPSERRARRLKTDQSPSRHATQTNGANDLIGKIKSDRSIRNQVPQQEPSDDIYDEIGPVQSETTVPRPPPMRKQRATQERKQPQAGELATSETGTFNKANDEAVYLEPQSVAATSRKSNNGVYENIAGDAATKHGPQSRTAQNETNAIESIYLTPQTVALTPSNDEKSTLPATVSKHQADSDYLVPQIVRNQVTAESEYLVPRTSDGRLSQTYANIDHLAASNANRRTSKQAIKQESKLTNGGAKTANANEYEYLNPQNLNGAQNQPVKVPRNVSESEYLVPRVLGASQTEYLVPQDVGSTSDYQNVPTTRRQSGRPRDAPPPLPPPRPSSAFIRQNDNVDSSPYVELQPMTRSRQPVYEALQDQSNVVGPDSMNASEADNSYYQPLTAGQQIHSEYEPLRDARVNVDRPSRTRPIPTASAPPVSAAASGSRQPAAGSVYESLSKSAAVTPSVYEKLRTKR